MAIPGAMRVSVLMPVYNKASFVKEAIDSVLCGSFQDLEIVAVDDRSTDGSLAVLRAIADPRLRIIELPENRGPAGAANAGLDACTGEYIVRLDADDLAVPDRIAKQVAFMDAHPDVGASGGWLQLFGARDVAWKFPLTDEDCKAQLLFGVPVSQGASIMRRDVLEAHRLRYDPAWPRVGEDWLFWARMMPHACFGNLDEAMTLYRRGEQNISHGTDKVTTHRAIMRPLFAMLGIPATDEEIDTHLMALSYFASPPDAEAVRALRRWLDRLLAINAERGLFPREAFRRKIEAQWDRLFHYLPRFGIAPALAHLRLGGRWPADRLLYLVKYRLNAIFGRLPTA